MSPSCQVIERNRSFFAGARWAVFNPDDASIFAIDEAFSIGLHFDYSMFQSSLSASVEQYFGHEFSASELGNIDGVLIFMPKAKALLMPLIEQACSLLGEHSTSQTKSIAVIGEHAIGAKGAGKLMATKLDHVIKYDNARRCSLFIGQSSKSGRFSFDSYLQINQFEIKQQVIKIATLPGVFGHRQLDPGTELLLNHLPTLENPAAKIYDFACGSGILGCYLKLLYPQSEVVFSDSSALALKACKESLLANKLVGTVEAADGFLQGNANFDYIVCNPPFHEGIKNNYEITQEFIKQAERCLKQNGIMYMVANKFLPYAESLQNSFASVSVLYQSTKYIIYVAKKSRKPR